MSDVNEQIYFCVIQTEEKKAFCLQTEHRVRGQGRAGSTISKAWSRSLLGAAVQSLQGVHAKRRRRMLNVVTVNTAFMQHRARMSTARQELVLTALLAFKGFLNGKQRLIKASSFLACHDRKFATGSQLCKACKI